MKCPLCKVVLVEVGPGVRHCPNRHGLLVSAKALKEGGAHAVRADVADGASVTPVSNKRVIYCPDCDAQMMVVDYGGLGIMIDVCFSCSCRWLDAGELTRIMKRRRPGRLQPEQLIALQGLHSIMRRDAPSKRLPED